MKKITLLFALVFLSSCVMEDTRVKNPQPKDIEGRWETLIPGRVIPYVQVYIQSDGSGFVIGADKEDAELLADFDSFVSDENSFYITAYFIGDEERVEPQVLEGVLDSDEICFSDPEETSDELPAFFCFKRYKQIQKYREQADKVYSQHKQAY